MAPRSASMLGLVLASVGLHAAVLGLSWQGAAWQPGANSSTLGGARRPVTWVSIGSPSVKRLADAPAPVRVQALSSELGPTQTTALLPHEIERLTTVTSEGLPVEPAGPTQQDVYLPRSQLSVPPVLRSQVLLPWPTASAGMKAGDAAPAGHYTEVLALYIDERGIVQRVRAEGNRLPPQLESVARDAFLGASFVPGELAGQTVKALIRVEVRFDADNPIQGKGLRR